MPPEDDFRRDSDPTTRRNAILLSLLLTALLAAVAAGASLTRTAAPLSAAPTPASVTPRQLSPSPVPSEPVVGSGFSATDDPATHQLVLFGGIDSYDTTWLWDGHQWSLAHPRVHPAGRFTAAAAYDPLTRMVMLYGGRLGPGDVVDDTWAWSGTTWRELDTGTGSPPAGEGSMMAWDGRLGEMILVNGEGGSASGTWIWNGSRWIQQAGGDLPTGTFFVGIAADPLTGALVASSCCSPDQGTASTWTWNGIAWHQISTRAQPAFTVALALDPVGGRPLLCGDPPLVSGQEMWSWTGQDWSLLAGARLPVFPEAEVTDTSRKRLVVLGSFDQPTQGAPQPIHVWSWTGSRWTQLG